MNSLGKFGAFLTEKAIATRLEAIAKSRPDSPRDPFGARLRVAPPWDHRRHHRGKFQGLGNVRDPWMQRRFKEIRFLSKMFAQGQGEVDSVR